MGPVNKDNIVLLVTSRLLLKENVPRPDVPEKMESAPFLLEKKQICNFCEIVPLALISILWTAESLRRVERILSFYRCQFLCHIYVHLHLRVDAKARYVMTLKQSLGSTQESVQF